MVNNLEKIWNERLNAITNLIPNKFLRFLVSVFILLSFIYGSIKAYQTVINVFFQPPPSEERILALSDKCQWADDRNHPGDYASCKEIFDYAEKYKNISFIQEQANFINTQYENISPVLNFFPYLPVMPTNKGDGGLIRGLQLKTNDLQNNSKFDWRIRAISSYLLRERPEKSVPEMLLNNIETDPSAFVRAIAIDSFCQLTGYQKNSPFDIDGTRKYFKDHELDIMKKLRPDNSIPVENGNPIYPINIKI